MPADTLHKKTVAVTMWEYRNADGKRRRAYRGDVIELTDAELERGTSAGVFDQPPAGPVDTPFIAKGITSANLIGVLADHESRTPLPVDAGDGTVAKLSHDLQPPATVEDQAGEDADGDADGGDADGELVELPPKVAGKPVLVQWVVTHARKEDGSQYTEAEIEGQKLTKPDLWAIINAAVVEED